MSSEALCHLQRSSESCALKLTYISSPTGAGAYSANQSIAFLTIPGSWSLRIKTEAAHKKQRYIREHLARKCSLEANLEDIQNHDWASRDPGVCSQDRKAHCIRCCIDGHRTRGCPIKCLFRAVSSDKDWIDNILLKDGQEEPEEQINLY